MLLDKKTIIFILFSLQTYGATTICNSELLQLITNDRIITSNQKFLTSETKALAAELEHLSSHPIVDDVKTLDQLKVTFNYIFSDQSPAFQQAFFSSLKNQIQHLVGTDERNQTIYAMKLIQLYTLLEINDVKLLHLPMVKKLRKTYVLNLIRTLFPAHSIFQSEEFLQDFYGLLLNLNELNELNKAQNKEPRKMVNVAMEIIQKLKRVKVKSDLNSVNIQNFDIEAILHFIADSELKVIARNTLGENNPTKRKSP